MFVLNLCHPRVYITVWMCFHFWNQETTNHMGKLKAYTEQQIIFIPDTLDHRRLLCMYPLFFLVVMDQIEKKKKEKECKYTTVCESIIYAARQLRKCGKKLQWTSIRWCSVMAQSSSPQWKTNAQNKFYTPPEVLELMLYYNFKNGLHLNPEGMFGYTLHHKMAYHCS